jgi:uncharacterized protein
VRVWIDLANSPHSLLFAPVARELGRAGHDVATTARDNAQTVELAGEWTEPVVIGGPSPKGRARKAAALARRIKELRRWARGASPDVALSHNSYAQIVAARSLGIRVVTAMDFEHQPANHLAFRLADEILVPAALRDSRVTRQGARAGKTRFYPGLKEEVYLGDFSPDPLALERLGIFRDPDTIVVVARTPPSRALYHSFDSPLFIPALELLAADERVRLVVLARHPEQRQAIESLGLARCVVPATAVDSRSLMYAADLVVGAGGTMTREAALLGVPTFSLFAGADAAVDTWLERHGRLRRLRSVDELLPLRPAPGQPAPVADLARRGAELTALFAAAAVGDAVPERPLEEVAAS